MDKFLQSPYANAVKFWPKVMVQQGLVSGHRIKARVSLLDHVGLTFWVDVWGRFSCINTSVNSVTKLCVIKRTRIFRTLKDNFCLGAKRPTFIDLICDDHLLVRVPSSPTRYLFCASFVCFEPRLPSPIRPRRPWGRDFEMKTLNSRI